MPATAAASSATSSSHGGGTTATQRNHGDMFLMADRKNRMERARLDRRLKLFDKDQARHQFCIDRQQKTIVTKWQGVSLTTGHSDRALPLDGPRDRVYDTSKHSQTRLSEKRLMEWKVRERQLDKFLRQFKTRPLTAQAPPPSRLKPRPFSSRPALGTSSSSSSLPLHQDVTLLRSRKQGRGGGDRVFGVGASGEEKSGSGLKKKKRCASAVSFSPRTEVFIEGRAGGFHGGDSDEDGCCWEEVEEEEEFRDDVKGSIPRGDVTDGSNNNGRDKPLHPFRSALRSVSVASTHSNYHHDPGGLPRSSNNNSAIRSPSAAAEDHSSSSASLFLGAASQNRDRPKTSLGVARSSASSHAQAAVDDLRTSARNYQAYLRACASSGTQFFVTKDNVLMANTLQHTVRPLHSREGGIHADTPFENFSSRAGRERSGHQSPEHGIELPNVSGPGRKSCSSRSEKMSVSSFSSDDQSDSVFSIAHDDEIYDDDDNESGTGVQGDLRNDTDIGNGSRCVFGEDVEKSKHVFDDVQEKPDGQRDGHSFNVNTNTSNDPAVSNWNTNRLKERAVVDRHGVTAELTTHPTGDAEKNTTRSPSPAHSVTGCMEKLTLTDDEQREKTPEGQGRGSGFAGRGRRYSHGAYLHSGVPLSDDCAAGDVSSRRHSLMVGSGGNVVEQPLRTVKMKWRQSSSAILRTFHTSFSSAKERRRSSTCLTSAMTVTALLRDRDKKLAKQTPRADTDNHDSEVQSRSNLNSVSSIHSNSDNSLPTAPPHTSKTLPPNKDTHNTNSKPVQTSTNHRPSPQSNLNREKNVNSDSPHTSKNVGLATSNKSEHNSSVNNKHPQPSKKNLRPPPHGSKNLNKDQHYHQETTNDDSDDDDDDVDDAANPRPCSQWRRDLALEQPPGLASVSAVGTVLRAALVFSKAARRRALSSMVQENNADTRELIRRERLRKLQSRASVLNKIVHQFPAAKESGVEQA